MDVTRFLEKEQFNVPIEFVTPCFLGGYDMNAELRTAPFKFGIRYWWRILYGADHGDKILEKELEIFGSTEHSADIRIFCNAIAINTSTNQMSGDKLPTNVNVLEYLAYGKKSFRDKKFSCKYIIPGQQINLEIEISKQYSEMIKNSLYCLLNFGGIGGKSKNGFGSLYSQDFSSYKKIPYNKQSCTYITFSENSRLYETKEVFDTWEKALSNIGIIYYNNRKSIQKKKVGSRIIKPVFLHVIKTSEGKYKGRISVVPMDGNNSKLQEPQGLIDITKNILG